MKYAQAISGCAMAMAAGAAWADALDLNLLVVYSQPHEQSATMTGAVARYTKQFRVGLAYLSDDKRDLDTLCLAAFSPEGRRFALDSIDEKLMKGTLRAEQVVKGFASFGAPDPSVYAAVIVKAVPCDTDPPKSSEAVRPRSESQTPARTGTSHSAIRRGRLPAVRPVVSVPVMPADTAKLL